MNDKKWIETILKTTDPHTIKMFIDIFYPIMKRFRRILPRFVRMAIKNLIYDLYKKLAIYYYMKDNKDLGLVENFLLSRDILEKITKEYMQSSRKVSYWIWKEVTTIGSMDRKRIEELKRNMENEMVGKTIYEKKLELIRILKEKGNILAFIKGRIPDEDLREKIEDILRMCD